MTEIKFIERQIMETTLQPVLPPSFRTRIVLIEAIELSILGFGLGSLMALSPGNPFHLRFMDLMTFFLFTEGIVLGSWLVYNVYIRIARAAGPRVDIALWMIASAFTGSYTFWTWTIFDLNRLMIARLFYRGEAPVEYAWSVKSKRARKLWEQSQTASSAP